MYDLIKSNYMKQDRNIDRVMETETISKNGLNMKRKMSREIKKMYAFFVLFALAGIPSACDKNNEIYEDGKNNSITVSGTISGECATWDEVRVSFDGEETWVASAPIQKEKFSLILPQPDTKLLVSIPDNAFPKEITISDKTAKIFGNVLFRAFKGSTRSRDPLFLVGQSSKGICIMDWLYANKDVSITGSYTNEDGDGRVYNAKMKKGWNVWLSYETKTLNEYGMWTGKVTMTYEAGGIGDIPVGAKWEELLTSSN